MLLSWIFISSYTLIFFFFFVKKFIFSNVNILVNPTCKCLYIIFGCERGHQLSTYPTLGDGGSSKMYASAYRGRACHALCVCTNLHYFFSCRWKHLCLIVSSFIFRNLTLSLFKKDQKRLFFSNKISLCRHEISFFHLKLFLLSKLAKTLLILIK